MMHIDIPTNVPTPVALGIGLFGLASGLAYMRHAARDTYAAARRLTSAASTYWVRAETARNYIKAIDTPTTALPLVQLEAATATRRERLVSWARELVERSSEAVTPEPGQPDWEEGEMTAAFRAIVEGDTWTFTQEPVNMTPEALSGPTRPTPVPPPPPPVVMAPRGVQTAPRWQRRPAPDAPLRQRPEQDPRQRNWLMGQVPRLELPEYPRSLRMPTQRRLPNDPRRLAMLPQDDTRQFRTQVVAG
jgi:hypothetical protein